MTITIPIDFTQGEEFNWNVGLLFYIFSTYVLFCTTHLSTGTQQNRLSVLKLILGTD